MDPTKAAARLLEAARKLAAGDEKHGPTMTPQLQKLVADAKAAGYTVERRNDHLDIVKRHKGHGKVYRGLRIWEDGMGMNIMVRLDVARMMRSYRDMRACLGLNT